MLLSYNQYERLESIWIIYTLLKKVKASMKYDKENVKQVKLSLNKKTDADVIAILESKDNVQGYIKELIRKDNQ